MSYRGKPRKWILGVKLRVICGRSPGYSIKSVLYSPKPGREDTFTHKVIDAIGTSFSKVIIKVVIYHPLNIIRLIIKYRHSVSILGFERNQSPDMFIQLIESDGSRRSITFFFVGISEAYKEVTYGINGILAS